MLNNDREVERKVLGILKVLSEASQPLGARIISQQLESQGVYLTERAVRYHLQLLDERGLTTSDGREGRRITKKGIEELSNALVSDKVGLVINKIDTLSYLTTFDPSTGKGKIALNTSMFPAGEFDRAVEAMRPVFAARHCVSDLVAVAESGQMLGDIRVPEGHVGFGTVCSVTINGILLKAGIPVESKFGGVLQVRGSKPLRFTDLISYAGSSLDPLEVFIRSKMTNVLAAANGGEGKLLASFREIPFVCQAAVEDLLAQISERRLGGLMALGQPGNELLDVPVGANQVGMVIIGGLNPVAAVEEVGIRAVNRALSTMYDFEALRSFWEL